MKPDEKWRQLRVEFQAADKVLDEALQPILKKLTIAGTDTARGQSSLEEAVRLIAAMDAWHDVNVQVIDSAQANWVTLRIRPRHANALAPPARGGGA
jgi:hypothetical protein